MATTNAGVAHGLEGRINTLDDKIDALQTAVTRIEATMLTRGEVSGELAKRVSIDMYQNSHQALVERITRIESGPQRTLGWISLAISGGLGCLSLTLVALGIIATILIAILTHIP